MYTEYNLPLMKEKQEYTKVLLNHKKKSGKMKGMKCLPMEEGWNRMVVNLLSIPS